MNDYRRWEDYFWPDAPDVLRNKLGIRDQRMLNFVEAQLSAVRIYEQVLENRTGAFNFAHYCDIHRRTFSDIFDWAGIPRTVPDGPMTKRHRDVVNFLINDPNAPTIEYRYRPGPQVRDSAEYVFARLQAGCVDRTASGTVHSSARNILGQCGFRTPIQGREHKNRDGVLSSTVPQRRRL